MTDTLHLTFVLSFMIVQTIMLIFAELLKTTKSAEI